ncbi:MAG: polysaccharide biosynthesis protein, partial [Gammaproteobacteria bacterium]|nr:polysaccharide biosynthesis protein [Gammaproteobacteria bacterium]
MLTKKNSNYSKQLSLILADLIWLPLALWLAIVLRWGEIDYTLDYRDFLVFSLTTLISIFIFLRLGLYQAVIRFMGTEAIIAVLKAISISALILG